MIAVLACGLKGTCLLKTPALAIVTVTLGLCIGINYARKPGVAPLQGPVGCYSWGTTFTPCGNNGTCGLGDYRSNQFVTGKG